VLSLSAQWSHSLQMLSCDCPLRRMLLLGHRGSDRLALAVFDTRARDNVARHASDCVHPVSFSCYTGRTAVSGRGQWEARHPDTAHTLVEPAAGTAPFT